MPTLLTNRKMPAPLAARIEASLRKGRGGTELLGRRILLLVRVVVIATIVGAALSLLSLRRHRLEELERSRKALLEAVRTQRASLSAEDLRAVSRIEVWFRQLSGSYQGDLVDAELRAPGALIAVLSRSTVYARGPLEAFGSSRGTAELAATSFKDALLLCLLDPPAGRSEAMMLQKVHAAYGGGPRFEERTRSVHRLYAAAMGLPLLAPAWSERVAAATDVDEIRSLAKQFAKAPIEEAKQAARARVLLAVMDEPGESKNGLSEIDGESPHAVRVAIVDLAAPRVLLRLRRNVDPIWISVEKRSMYAKGLDGCSLALDVRETVEGR